MLKIVGVTLMALMMYEGVVIIKKFSPPKENSKARIKGRLPLPKRMNFRKSSKRGGGVIFNPKIYIAKFGPLSRAI